MKAGNTRRYFQNIFVLILKCINVILFTPENRIILLLVFCVFKISCKLNVGSRRIIGIVCEFIALEHISQIKMQEI
jgi:hypothetical protein